MRAVEKYTALYSLLEATFQKIAMYLHVLSICRSTYSNILNIWFYSTVCISQNNDRKAPDFCFSDSSNLFFILIRYYTSLFFEFIETIQCELFLPLQINYLSSVFFSQSQGIMHFFSPETITCICFLIEPVSSSDIL